jgi:branched-chain amino acid transport system ATP-binding protein
VTTLLDATGITVRFGGHEALRGVDLAAAAGEITGLIGPNGAGKTTLFNVLCGLQKPLHGQVLLGGRDVTRLAPHRRARLGLARTFQRLETFTLLSVRENVLSGAEFRRRWAGADESPGDTADRLLHRLGLEDVAEDRVDTLPTGRARLVELARALAARPRVLLLDEPSSGLDERETDELGAVLRSVVDDDLGILLVEHDMAMVMSVCNRVSVLDFGALIADGTPQEIQGDRLVQQAYLGDASRSRGSGAGPATVRGDVVDRPPMLEVRDLRAGYGDIDVLDGVDLDVAAGEVFALLGPNGAGKSTFLKALGGLVRPFGGSVRILGHDVTGADADALARAGICTVPEGRGVFPNLSVRENLVMAARKGRDGRDDWTYARVMQTFPRLAEREGNLGSQLSGGEQQMLSIGRALMTHPDLVILDEATEGLAPLIVAEIWRVIDQIRSSGIATLIVDRDYRRVLAHSDRALVLQKGQVVLHGDAAPLRSSAELAGYLGV